eukprot:3790744-Amphidinium_carterae.2
MEFSPAKMPAVPNQAGTDFAKRERVWLSSKFKLIMKKQCSEAPRRRSQTNKRRLQDAEEAERLRQMNADLPHLKE